PPRTGVSYETRVRQSARLPRQQQNRIRGSRVHPRCQRDGTGLRVLSAYGRDPSVSRDGTKIGLDRRSNAGDHIVAMRADWRAARRVGSAAGRLALWSPDGSRIVTIEPTRSLSSLAPVSSPLAADGSRAAVALGCAVATWDASAGRLDRAATLCPDESYLVPAVAGHLTASVLDEGGGPTSRPQPATPVGPPPGGPARPGG